MVALGECETACGMSDAKESREDLVLNILEFSEVFGHIDGVIYYL